MILDSAIGFRACSAVLGVIHELFPQLPTAPAPNTVQSWLLRVGLHELQRPKEKAADWVVSIDYTLQLGAWKCLVVVGIRQSLWEQLDRPVTHHDLTLLALEPVQKSGGDHVNRQLVAVAKQIGVPAAILSDEGSDLANGVAQFQEKHPQTKVFNDLAHKAAIFLKRELLADPRWDAFVKYCGQTQPKVKQTELGHLAPPTQKTKARYMNLGPLIRWGEKMLRLVDTPAPQRPEELDLSRLDEKFGWIRDFRVALVEWNDLETVKDQVLEYGRVQGYHVDAGEQLREQLALIAQTLPGRRLATALIEFAGDQSKCLERGQSFPASTEVLESLIGKGKRLQGQHSRGGFTHMILGMAASVVQITHETIKQALENIRDIDLRDWCAKNLGPSLTAQRRQALPAIPEILTIPGTETG